MNTNFHKLHKASWGTTTTALCSAKSARGIRAFCLRFPLRLNVCYFLLSWPGLLCAKWYWSLGGGGGLLVANMISSQEGGCLQLGNCIRENFSLASW